jgi:hypothetical protein
MEMQEFALCRGKTMPRHPNSHILAVAAGLTVVILLSPHRVLAASDCLAQPNDQTAAGGHWYYRSDHVNDRRCWHLAEPKPTAPQTEAPEMQPPDATAQLPFPFSLFTAANPAATQVISNGDVRTKQANPSDELKNRDRVQVKLPRTPTQPFATAALTLKQQPVAPIRPHGEHAIERTALSLTEAERVALFKKFLQWKNAQISETQ